jgi:hypothetical protein
MPLWLGGNTWVVATGWGIARWDGAKYDVFRYPRLGAGDPPELELFAVADDDGTLALVRRAGEATALWRIGAAGGEVGPCECPPVLAAVGTGGGALIVVAEESAGGGERRAVVRRARVDGDRVVLGDPIALPAARRVALARAGEFRADRADGELARYDRYGAHCAIRIAESPHGITITGVHASHVIVLDRATGAAQFVLRLPALAAEDDLFALAVPQGVLVTRSLARREAHYALIDPAGEVVGSCDELGKAAPTGARSEGVFCGETVEIASDDRLWTLALPTLRPRKHPGGGDAFPIAHGVTADGARLVAYAATNLEKPQSWRLVHTPGGSGRRRGREVNMPDFRPPPEPASPAQPARVVGAAALGLVAEKTPWQVAVGAEAELRLDLSNRGGPVKGIFVELTGDTVGKTVAPIEIVAGDQVAPFAGSRAELADLALDPGYVEPTGKRPRQAPPLPPPPSVSVVIRVRGAGAGSGLLMVRIGALAGGATAMQGRGITVG